MHRLFLHPHAIDDLKALHATKPSVADEIRALLQEIKADPNLMEALTDHGFGTNRVEPFNVSKWLKYWRQGQDLWRLKFWDLEDAGLAYRVIYCYMPDELAFYVLAVAHRSHVDYDNENDLTRRVIADYEEL